MADKMPSYSDLPGIIKSHPLGLLISVIVLGILLIYSGTIGCAIKEVIFSLLNKSLPNCNPNNIFRVKVGEWIISLLNHEWFIWMIIIAGVIIYYLIKNGKKQN